MTIEDRVRQLMTDAVADEPPPRGAPLERALRRRGRRPALAGAVALVLVLAAVVGLVAVRRSGRAVPPAAPTLTTLPTAGWPEVVDDAGNLRFRRPPGWQARKSRGVWYLAPPEVSARAKGRPEFRVTIASGGHWRYDGPFRVSSSQVGRLPGGQAYRFTATDPPERGGYVVDWGRACRGAAAPGSCQPRSVHVGYFPTGDKRYGGRYLPEVETVVGSLRPVRPTAPTVGDRGRPVCRADQWVLVHPRAWGSTTDERRLAIPAGVGFRGGPPCHLRASIRLAIQQDGRLLPIRGNPAPATIELDLPEDALPDGFAGMAMRGDRMLLRWTWDEMCDRELGITDRTEMAFSDERGRRLLTLGIELTGFSPELCGDRGRRSVLSALS